MPKRFIRHMAKSGPIPVVWVFYISLGATLIGLFSIPSQGSAIVLIPMFLTVGAVTTFGIILRCIPGHRECSRYVVVVGLALMILASWTRAISLWGVDQGGAGSNILATLVWGWITLGCVLLFIAVWMRGIA